MKKVIKKEEYEKAVELRDKIYKIVNIILTIISLVGATVSIFLFMFNVISIIIAGILIPLFLSINMILNILSSKNDERKGILIFYIIALSICIIVLFIDIIYYLVNK